MTNVLLDRHHASLFYSMELMARRFGWTIYTPTGMEWWEQFYWSFGRGAYGDDRLAQQYLMAPQVPDIEYPDTPIRYVTLDEAKAMDWAYVIATLQDNQDGFARFARETGATYVYQVGNTGQQIDWHLNPLVLSSSEMPIEGRGVVYHQEFDSAGLFAFVEPYKREPIVRSFVHLLHETACFPLWQEFSQLVPFALRYGHPPPGFVPNPTGDVDIHGGYVENAKPTSKIADYMAASSWGWHDKPHGDGFGHVLHGWAAVGRPLIGHASHYRSKMGEPFWRDGETCIDLDRHSVQEAAEMVNGIGWDEYVQMCRAIRATFDELVDYDKEAAAIRALLTMVPA